MSIRSCLLVILLFEAIGCSPGKAPLSIHDQLNHYSQTGAWEGSEFKYIIRKFKLEPESFRADELVPYLAASLQKMGWRPAGLNQNYLTHYSPEQGPMLVGDSRSETLLGYYCGSSCDKSIEQVHQRFVLVASAYEDIVGVGLLMSELQAITGLGEPPTAFLLVILPKSEWIDDFIATPPDFLNDILRKRVATIALTKSQAVTDGTSMNIVLSAKATSKRYLTWQTQLRSSGISFNLGSRPSGQISTILNYNHGTSLEYFDSDRGAKLLPVIWYGISEAVQLSQR